MNRIENFPHCEYNECTKEPFITSLIFLNWFPFFAKNELDYEAELKPFDQDQEKI